MKFKNIFAGILASVALASTMLGATTASAATSKRISNVLWNGQEKNYWCGYAALTSAINNEYKNKNLKTNYNYSWSQSNVADYMQDYYNMHPYDNINYDGSLAGYIGSKNVDTDQSKFPAGRMLTDITQVFRWVAYGPCTTGSSTLASSEVKKKVVSTTKANHAVLACGRSNNSGTSYLPNYPARKIEHWIVSDGYTNDGDYIWVVDPAAAGCGGSDFKSVQKYYKISVSKFTDFAWYHGIIWGLSHSQHRKGHVLGFDMVLTERKMEEYRESGMLFDFLYNF